MEDRPPPGGLDDTSSVATLDINHASPTNGRQSEINVDSLEELAVSASTAAAIQDTWAQFLSMMESREAAGEAIFAAIFEAAPSLQELFKTARAVHAMRFTNVLNSAMQVLDNPRDLKILAETVGFGHLNLEVTAPKGAVFRDSILDLFESELGDALSNEGRAGWEVILNYIIGACIYVRRTYAERLRVLAASWEKANNREPARNGLLMGSRLSGSGSSLGSGDRRGRDAEKKASSQLQSPQHSGEVGKKGESGSSEENRAVTQISKKQRTSFKEMFEVNLAVMGYGNHKSWLLLILNCWDSIVTNVQNFIRLQEECDVLVLRLSKETTKTVDLRMYRSCMLASLRSLLPKDWDGTHEVAWNWLWDNVERLLKGSLGRPRIWEAALARSLDGMDDSQKFKLRKALYIRFFQTTPQGQEYFKQSDTRLHFIADRIMQMSMELYQDPVKMVDELSGLGLRHVGYAIPPELMNPFVCAFMDELSLKTSDETAIEAARWSLNLICKMLVRTINEGSTLVMKAINANSVKQLRKAISVATRRGRSQSMLNIQVGRHAISPLDWALQSGSLDAARAILEDLLTIRADRERYYYGMEDLFSRHPDIIRRLCKDAPALLPTLLGGLVWRSQQAKEGVRRANYYVKHLVLDSEGGVSKAMEWLCEAKDPKIMIHPVVLKVSSILWNGFVRRLFILSRSWFVMSLIVFMLSQALLPKMPNVQNSRTLRIVVFAGRLLNYTFTMFRLKAQHLGQTFRHLRDRDLTTRLWCFPVPRYLEDFQEIGSLWLLLLLMLMCAHEPMLWCLSSSDVGSDEWPTEFCEESDHVRFRYSLFTAFAMVVHWGMLIDLAVFSTALSAFVLICGQVLSEFSRFLVALTFLIFTFASSISVLEHDYLLMRDIPRSAVALFGITVAIFEDDYRDMSHEPALLCAVLLFVTFTVILLMNLLIAQLNTTYVRIYQDTVGWALINRASTIVEVLSTVSMTKWTRFVEGLGFDEKLEFNEGDVGLPGGVVEAEPASMHPVVHESILRFGGSCKGDEPWPESNEMLEELEEDKLDKLEKVIRRTCRKLGTSRAAVGRRAAAEGA